MKKILSVFLCLAIIVALFTINNENKEFSFEAYLTNLSQVSDDRPTMPSTEDIVSTFEEFGNYDTENTDLSFFNGLKDIWTALKLIYECVVFAIKFLIYIVEYIVYIGKVGCALFYNLLVW